MATASNVLTTSPAAIDTDFRTNVQGTLAVISASAKDVQAAFRRRWPEPAGER